jgi:hypothetical protein
MEGAGAANYLFALAALAMTFAGFCAIVIVLRQAIGEGLSGFHVLLTSLYLEAGLGTTAFCMLPPLLALEHGLIGWNLDERNRRECPRFPRAESVPA